MKLMYQKARKTDFWRSGGSYLYDISMYDVAYRHPQAAPSKTSIIQAGRSVLNNVDVSGDCTLT